MRNYILSEQVRKHLLDCVGTIAARPRDLALHEFPLTVAQVQYHCAMLTNQQITQMRALVEDKVSIEKHQQVRIACLREDFPELSRNVILLLAFPEWIVVRRNTYWKIDSPKFRRSDTEFLLPDLQGLGAETCAALVRWIENALVWERRYTITMATARAVVNTSKMSVADLWACWPALVKTFNPEGDSDHYLTATEREHMKQWQIRLRNPPTRGLKEHRPPLDLYNKMAPLIEIGDVMLAHGMVLGESQTGRGHPGIWATIDHWEQTEEDRRSMPDFALQKD